MILCESARQTINLCYSVIKFLHFEGFTWEGESFPFRVKPIGELMQARLDVKEVGGARLEHAKWENGLLYGPFRRDRLYELSLRLEYGLPMFVQEFECDFSSIYPQDYEVALDFPIAGGFAPHGSVGVRLGARCWDISIEEPLESVLDTGHEARVTRDREYCGFSISARSSIPYGHDAFPVLTPGGGIVLEAP